MNWDALAAIGEVVGAIAVFVTLVYLSIQVRYSNRQAEIEALRHTWDGLNQFCDSITQSDGMASILNRGRESLSNLDEDELVMFEHLHLRLLNTLESWHLQVDQTSPPGAYRTTQMENIAGVAQLYLSFPGTLDLWEKLRPLFVPIQGLVSDALVLQGGDADPDGSAV